MLSCKTALASFPPSSRLTQLFGLEYAMQRELNAVVSSISMSLLSLKYAEESFLRLHRTTGKKGLWTEETKAELFGMNVQHDFLPCCFILNRQKNCFDLTIVISDNDESST